MILIMNQNAFTTNTSAITTGAAIGFLQDIRTKQPKILEITKGDNPELFTPMNDALNAQ